MSAEKRPRTNIFLPKDAESSGRAFRAYLEHLCRNGRQWKFTGQTKEELRQWQAETRTRLLDLLGVPPKPANPPACRREVIETTESARIERVQYETLPGVVVSAFLIVPRRLSGSAPAVLCPPGHGGGMRQVLYEEGIYKRYPLALAERGFVCLIPEHLGFGEREDTEGDSSHGYYTSALLLLGWSAMGVFLHDLLRGLDVLAALPETDATRIGCWGLSLGGEMTLFAAAVDTRLRAAAISGFLGSYECSFLSVPHCGCGYAPGLARYLEHVDIASLIAPRPLWVETASEDPLFPHIVTESVVAELRPLYSLEAVPAEALTYHVFPGGHELSGAPVIEWFVRTLRPAGT